MKSITHINPLRWLKLMSFAGACLLLAATRSPAQLRCPENPSPDVTEHAAKSVVGAEVAQPKTAGGKNKIDMMQAPKKASTLAVAAVQVACVPDFTGMTLDQAKAEIEKKRLRFENATPANGGTVTDQNPKPLRYVTIGTGVTLRLNPSQRVSRLRQVPDITHIDESMLTRYLKDAGLTYGGSTKTETNDFPAGTIFQDPLARKWVEENTPVFRYEATAPPNEQTNHQLSLSASATELSINEQVTFVARLTPAVNGTGYQFDFGDNQQGDLQAENTTRYHYARDGTFTVVVTAHLPNGEMPQAKTTVQVHAITWTVVLEPSLRRAETNTPIVFEVKLLPTSPVPDHAEYIFYFDNDKKPVVSNVQSVQKIFSDARTHSARVVVRDADGHSFKSNTIGVVIIGSRPVWPWMMASTSAIAILGLGGFKIARKITTARLKYAWVADVRGTQLITAVPQGVVEAAFEFRVVNPPLDVSPQCAGPIIKRVEIVV